MNFAEPIRERQHVDDLLSYYSNLGENRNHLLIAMCLFTALRISDILSLSCDDVYDFTTDTIRKTIHITEKQTGKSRIIPLHSQAVSALDAYKREAKAGVPLFLNPRTGKAISRIQAHRIISRSGDGINLPYPISSHALRKTIEYHAWKEGNAAIMGWGGE